MAIHLITCGIFVKIARIDFPWDMAVAGFTVKIFKSRRQGTTPFTDQVRRPSAPDSNSQTTAGQRYVQKP